MDNLPLFCQFGFRRNSRGGQVVRVSVGGELVRTGQVEFVSNPAKRQTECWWAGTIEVSPGVAVHLETRVGVRGAGRDSERSTDQHFVADPDAAVLDVSIQGVGFERYPLVKGRLRPVSQKSDQDRTLAAVDAQVDGIDDD